MVYYIFGMAQWSIGEPLVKIYHFFKILNVHHYHLVFDQDLTQTLLAPHHFTSIDSPLPESQIKVLSIHDLGVMQ